MFEPTHYQIRPMQLEDIPDITAIEEQFTPIPFEGYSNELLNNPYACYFVLVAYFGSRPGQIIGYIGHWIMAGESHISIIATDPAWRGRKLGALLLLHTLMIAIEQEATIATLEVRSSNEAAQNLYLKYGFEIVGERPRYYRDNGEDALIMTVDLDRPYPQQVAYWLEELVEQLTSEVLFPAGCKKVINDEL